MTNEQQETPEEESCTACEGDSAVRKRGWKWSIFTLAALIVAGLATTQVLANARSTVNGKAEAASAGDTCAEGVEAKQCPLTTRAAKKQDASGEAETAKPAAKAGCCGSKAQGAAGEVESGKEGCSASKAACGSKAQGAAGEVASGKAGCCSSKAGQGA